MTPAPHDAARILWGLLVQRKSSRFPITGYEMALKFEFGIDDKSTIKIEAGDARSLLDLDGLDLRRIRRCEICNEYYYAPREDSRACSERHTSTLRQRDYRKLDNYRSRGLKTKSKGGKKK